MPETMSYDVGTPGWVELSTPDMRASKAFYRGLFGWSSYTLVDTVVGDYEVFTLDGPETPPVAGLSPLTDDAMSPSWTCYFTVRDLDEATRAIRDAGGQVVVDRLDMGRMGLIALAFDGEGAGFGLWERRALDESAQRDEMNTLAWVELTCRDTASAKEFYGRVLGWKEPLERRATSGDVSYLWRVEGRPVATLACDGSGELEKEDGASARWVPCFAVADCAAAASEAMRLGGSVASPCSDTPIGCGAGLVDSTFAPLSIIQPPP